VEAAVAPDRKNPRLAEGRGRFALLQACGAILLLVPVGYALGLAWQWFYYPAPLIEQLLSNGPFRGYGRLPMLREMGFFLLEVLLLAVAIAVLLRQRGFGWLRAARDAALHLLPLGLAPLLLFVDDMGSRIYLYAALVAAVAGTVAFRGVAPATGDGRRSPWPRRLARVAAVGAATWYFTLALLQHAAYWSSFFDLGMFAEALRSTMHGDGILWTPHFGMTFLAEHFSPILLLLAPIYAVAEDPMTLQLVQSLSMAGTGYLIFVLAEETLEDGWLALAFAVSYLLLPTTFLSQWHGFKMDLLEPPLIVGAVLAVRRGDRRWFLLLVALLWATKEDACVPTALLGLWAWLAHGWRRLGPIVIAASVVYGALLFAWVLPAYALFQEPGTYMVDFNRDLYKFSRHFFHLGPNLAEAMWRAATNPLYSLGYLFSEQRMGSVLLLLGPCAFLALAGGWRNLLLLVPTLEMLLANFGYMYTLDVYYSCVPMALAYPAAIFGLAKILARLRTSVRWPDLDVPRRVRAAAAAYLGAAVLLLLYLEPHSPVSPVNSRPAYVQTPRTRLLDEVLDAIPPDVPVAATGYAAIHLTNRTRLAQLPFGLERAQWVLIDLYRPPWPFPGGLATLVPFTRRILDTHDWGVVRSERGVFLLRRGAPQTLNARVLAQIDEPDFEAEEWEQSVYPNLAFQDPSCSNGAALRVTPSDRRGPGKLMAGPDYPLSPGPYRATFRLAASRASYEGPGRLVATLDVAAAGGAQLAILDLRFGDFASAGGWQEFTLDFEAPPRTPLEFRVHYHDAGTLALDVIRIRKRGP
jgi:uncharacterized membrane protein